MSKDNQSTYYDAGGIETLDIIKAKLTPEQYKGYLLGNAIKYQCRMMHKTPDNPKQDAEKAANYSRWLSESLKDESYKRFLSEPVDLNNKDNKRIRIREWKLSVKLFPI